MTDKQRDHPDAEQWPGDEIPGKRQDEMHHGAEAAIDMTEYALADAERVALGEERLEPSAEDEDAHEPERSEPT